MTEIEIIAIARMVAEAEGWPWEEPVQTRLLRSEPGVFLRWLLKRRGEQPEPTHWHVMSNINYMGRNVNIRISDETGEIISRNFAKR